MAEIKIVPLGFAPNGFQVLGMDGNPVPVELVEEVATEERHSDHGSDHRHRRSDHHHR